MQESHQNYKSKRTRNYRKKLSSQNYTLKYSFIIEDISYIHMDICFKTKGEADFQTKVESSLLAGLHYKKMLEEVLMEEKRY